MFFPKTIFILFVILFLFEVSVEAEENLVECNYYNTAHVENFIFTESNNFLQECFSLKNFELVPVRNSNNRADVTGFGSVREDYQIGKYDVTAEQYCAFLNAVASKEDPYELYDERMTTDKNVASIDRTGDRITGYIYTPKPNCAKLPIVYVSWYDAIRFCNWLHHGMPSCEEVDAETTETGAYSIHKTISEDIIEKNQEARFFLPSQNQWYKAAYYRPQIENYWNYPTCALSPLAPSNQLGTLANQANYCISYPWGDKHCTKKPPYLTQVGAFIGSASSYGAFDMGGNVAQWTFDLNEESLAIARGGSWRSEYSYLKQNELQNSAPGRALDPYYGYDDVGFRVVAPLDNPSKSCSIKHVASLSNEIKWGGEALLSGTEFIFFNIAPEVLEGILYAKLKLAFLIPYITLMTAEIAYEYFEKEYDLAATLLAHMCWDVSIVLAAQIFNFDLAGRVCRLLEGCGLGFAKDGIIAMHKMMDDIIHYLGIPHTHEEIMIAEDGLLEDSKVLLKRTQCGRSGCLRAHDIISQEGTSSQLTKSIEQEDPDLAISQNFCTEIKGVKVPGKKRRKKANCNA